MRLYSRTGATAVDAADGHFEAGQDGGFDFPEDLGQHLHGFAVSGERMWETDIERQHRLITEETARRADPATLLAAVEKLVAQAEAAPEAPAARPPRAASSKASPAAKGASGTK